MPVTTMAGGPVHDSGAMIVTGDVVIRVPNLNMDIVIAFNEDPGEPSDTPERITLTLLVDLAKPFEGDLAGFITYINEGAPPFRLHYNLGASRAGSAILTWTVSAF